MTGLRKDFFSNKKILFHKRNYKCIKILCNKNQQKPKEKFAFMEKIFATT